MRSGLEGTSSRNYGAWVHEPQLGAARAGAADARARPATEMDYSTGNTHLLSAILTKATGDEHLAVRQRGAGQAARLHARAVAARPAGHLLRRQRHADDAAPDAGVRRAVSATSGAPTAGRSCRRVGGAIVRGPRARIPSWARGLGPGGVPIRCATASTATAGGCTTSAGHETCFAWGYGGQYVFVVPDLDLVIVTTSSPDVSDERRGHRRQVFDILTRLVVTPLAAARTVAPPR